MRPSRYDDSLTPSVYFENYNRAGLPRNITDASGTSVLAYDHANRLISVTGQEGGLFPGIVVSNHFNQVHGRDLLQVLNLNAQPSNLTSAGYAFDTYGRLGTVSVVIFPPRYRVHA